VDAVARRARALDEYRDQVRGGWGVAWVVMMVLVVGPSKVHDGASCLKCTSAIRDRLLPRLKHVRHCLDPLLDVHTMLIIQLGI
jgi:hypothetical protein